MKKNGCEIKVFINMVGVVFVDPCEKILSKVHSLKGHWDHFHTLSSYPNQALNPWPINQNRKRIN